MDATSEIVTKLDQGNRLTGQLVNTISGWFPRAFGSFTMSGALQTVTEANCSSSSYVVLIPTNAAAGTLQGSAKCLYVTAGNGSFACRTASGVASAGTETFQYVIFTPL